jgi:hypothetical protein
MAQLFGDERCTAAILEFLATTEVVLRLGGRKARLLAGDDDSGDEYDEEAQDEGWEELGEDEGG